MKALFVFVTFLFVSFVSVAQEVIPLPEGFFEQLLSVALGQKWVALGAGVVLFGVFAFRKFVMPKLNVGSGLLPWLSLILGVLYSVALAVFGGVDPKEAIRVALFVGPAASAFWDAVLKLMLKKD